MNGICDQEKDAAALQAEAQTRAALARDTLAALAAGAEPHAVEGYVPRSSPGIAAARGPKCQVNAKSADSDMTTCSSSPPLDAARSSEQSPSTGGPAEQHDNNGVAPGQYINEQSRPAAGTPEARVNASQSRKHGTQNVSATLGPASQASAFLADAETPGQHGQEIGEDDRESHACGVTFGAKERPQQPAHGIQESATASGNAQVAAEAEHDSAEGVASASAHPVQQPVLVCPYASPASAQAPS